MKIKIYHPEGSAPYTDSVVLSNASTHVAARDQWAVEAKNLIAYHAGNWDHWTETDSGDDWAEYEYDHDSAKNSGSNSDWVTVDSFGATFPDGDGTGACDVSVQIGQIGDYWYLRTTDDAGGSDDCDATAYDGPEAAESAANAYAEAHDECDGQSAEAWLESERRRAIEAGKSEAGEYVLVHKDGTRWDADRYNQEESAAAAIAKWYADVKAANPGTDIIWHLMDTPELARLDDDGKIEMVSAEND